MVQVWGGFRDFLMEIGEKNLHSRNQDYFSMETLVQEFNKKIEELPDLVETETGYRPTELEKNAE
jgi:hypothetical protein